MARDTHAIELASLLLETTNQEHFAQGFEFLLSGEFGYGTAVGFVPRRIFRGGFLGSCCHGNPRSRKS